MGELEQSTTRCSTDKRDIGELFKPREKEGGCDIVYMGILAERKDAAMAIKIHATASQQNLALGRKGNKRRI